VEGARYCTRFTELSWFVSLSNDGLLGRYGSHFSLCPCWPTVYVVLAFEQRVNESSAVAGIEYVQSVAPSTSRTPSTGEKKL